MQTTMRVAKDTLWKPGQHDTGTIWCLEKMTVIGRICNSSDRYNKRLESVQDERQNLWKVQS